jgi:hypothetical protein
MSEQIETCSKKVRGRAQRSIDLIDAMYDAAKEARPITGRGSGYKLFTAGLIPSMARNEMQRVSRIDPPARGSRAHKRREPSERRAPQQSHSRPSA